MTQQNPWQPRPAEKPKPPSRRLVVSVLLVSCFIIDFLLIAHGAPSLLSSVVVALFVTPAILYRPTADKVAWGPPNASPASTAVVKAWVGAVTQLGGNKRRA